MEEKGTEQACMEQHIISPGTWHSKHNQVCFCTTREEKEAEEATAVLSHRTSICFLPICSSLLVSKHTQFVAGRCSECQSCSEHRTAQPSTAPRPRAGRTSLTNTAATRWQTHSPNGTLRTVTGSPRAVKSREQKANKVKKKKKTHKPTGNTARSSTRFSSFVYFCPTTILHEDEQQRALPTATTHPQVPTRGSGHPWHRYRRRNTTTFQHSR